MYKFEVRISLLANLSIDRSRALQAKDEILKTLKKQFPLTLPGKHFYPELILEILEEDYGPNSPELRKAVLEKFKIEQTVQRPMKQEVSFKDILLEGIRALAACSRPWRKLPRNFWTIASSWNPVNGLFSSGS
jgi:hypothetical protein